MYGEAPEVLGTYDLSVYWTEFMHYLYLPVIMKGGVACRLPKNLEFLREIIYACDKDQSDMQGGKDYDLPYCYVSAVRGFATPGNALNRPGWHCDDFGGADINYIWCDKFPTQFLESDRKLNIPADDTESMKKMNAYAEIVAHGDSDVLRITTYPENSLLRLTPYVIHSTSEIPAPGGMRSFFKISFSQNKYNLLGNSHNYEFDYDWHMYSREKLRNQPHGNGDYVKED